VIVATAGYTYPTAPEPLAAACDDGLAGLQGATQHQRLAKTRGNAHGGEPLAHRIGSRNLACETAIGRKPATGGVLKNDNVRAFDSTQRVGQFV
jgi:hypothetical protein